MSEDSSKGKSAAASFFGTVVGAVAGALIGHAREVKSQASMLVSNIFNPKSEFHTLYNIHHEAVEELAQVEATLSPGEQLSPGRQAIREKAEAYVAEHQSIMKDADTIAHSQKYQTQLERFQQGPEYRQVTEAQTALEQVRNNPKFVHSVKFTEHNGMPVTEIQYYDVNMVVHPNGKMVGERGELITANIPGVGATKDLITSQSGAGRILSEEQIETLANTNWLAEAEKAIVKAEESFLPQYEKIFLEAAPKEWIKKHVGTIDSTPLWNGGAIGALIGGMVAAVVVGLGAHARRAAQDKKAQAEGAAQTLF